MQVNRIPPPPQCFSCGKVLPEKDYNTFHSRVGTGEDARAVLDSLKHYAICCRTMFVGDAVEYRRLMALYDENTLNEQAKFF